MLWKGGDAERDLVSLWHVIGTKKKSLVWEADRPSSGYLAPLSLN